MNARKKTLILLPVLALIIGGGIGYYMFNKPHADLESSGADFRLSAADLLQSFSEDETKANTTYLNKIVEVSGTVAEKSVSETGDVVVFLKEDGEMFGVSCAFVPEAKAQADKLSEGSQVSIRGICSGMLMDVNLTRCIVVN